MTYILWILGILILLWLSSKATTSSSKKPSASTATGTHRDTKPPRFVGDLTAAGELSWVLNPASPLPLTVVGADRKTASDLKRLLGRTKSGSDGVLDIAWVIARHNLSFPEVDSFVAEQRARVDAKVARRASRSSEWKKGDEEDREELRCEFELDAVDSLDVSVGSRQLRTLLDGGPERLAVDDELLARLGGDLDLYGFYLRRVSSDSLWRVIADDENNAYWEKLASKGLTRRGAQISAKLLVEQLNLDDLNALLVERAPKRFGRKERALEAVLALPDLPNRLVGLESIEGFIQAVAEADIDARALADSFTYARQLAAIVQQTYYTGVCTLDAIDEGKSDWGPLGYSAWEIENQSEPACAKSFCKRYARMPAKRPPFHVGCDCEFRPTTKD